MQTNDKQVGLCAKDGYAEIGLLSAHVSGRLNGLVAQIKVRQVYKNWSDTNVECVYTFPLAWQSFLLGMDVELNGKKLSGTVKPKKVAEAQYEKAIDSGDLPVMLERSGKDLYTANIGNIQTGDEVVIELVFAQVLKAQDGCIRFNLPTTIAPRYGDASGAGLKPHQQLEANPQAEQRLFLTLELSEGLSNGTVHSPTHEIQLSRQGKECSVKLEGAAWLDRDFVLVVDRIRDLNFAVAAPDPVRAGEATVLSGAMFRSAKPNEHQPAAIKVLVDCSGSMQGDSIQQARDCLNWLIGQLSSKDKISFSRFGSSVEHDHPALQACSTVYRQLLKSSARKLAADLGGTEIDDALKEVIAIKGDDSEDTDDAVILLITDGEVWNIDEIIATVRASGHRIYAVGVGSAPSESLLKDMAEVTGGACEMVTPRENMQKAVERLLMRMRQTQAIEQEISYSAPALWQSNAFAHAADGESLTAWAQVQIQESERNSLQIQRVIFPGEVRETLAVEWDSAIELSRISAAFRLHDLSRAKERESLAMEYQLVSSETNLILIHERAEAEKAEELPELVQVKPMLAAGWAGNGSVRYSRAAPPLQVLRSGTDNVAFISECRSDMMSAPAVWRSARNNPSRMVSAMSSTGMDDVEIPAFLRKQADSIQTKSDKSVVSKLMDIIVPSDVPAPEKAAPVPPKAAQKAPHPTPDDLIAAIQNRSAKNNPIQEFIKCFNQAALTHTNFRSALAVCMRTNQASFLQWLVTKHMKAAGSAAPVWAVFIVWAAKNFTIQLDRHAERLLRDFLKSVNPVVQDSVRVDLEGIQQQQA